MYWEYYLSKDGIPTPGKCEFTASIPVKNAKPPHVCHNDVECAVLVAGREFLKRGDITCWEQVLLEERDAWFFLCGERTRLIFLNLVYHNDKTYPINQRNRY